MLSPRESETLASVCPGTPMGTLLRRYWHPVAVVDDMRDRWTKRVKILGENLVLFKDLSGTFGLIGEYCPHRRASIARGIPTLMGLRCPGHGWEFDGTGRCVAQPDEPCFSTFKSKVALPSYPVDKLGGLLWAYLGPVPAPLIPRLDGFIDGPAIRMCAKATVRCNWLRIMEHALGPLGIESSLERHEFDEFEHGILKRPRRDGRPDESSVARNGCSIVFPNILAVRRAGAFGVHYAFQIRVPIDDLTTDHYWYDAFIPPRGVVVPHRLLDHCPAYDVPQRESDGESLLEYPYARDIYAWQTLGRFVRHDREAPMATNAGIVMLHEILRREIEHVRAEEDPLGVVRDPAKNARINLPRETAEATQPDAFAATLPRHVVDFAPFRDELLVIFEQAATANRIGSIR